MSQTIKQLADSLGVSKTAIRKYLTPEFRAKYTANQTGNSIVIDDEGCKLIAETFRKPAESFRKPPQTTANLEPETTGNQVSGDVVALLQSTIAALQLQLEVKDRQIAELTETLKTQAASLQAAQALHAGTMHQMMLNPAEEPVQARQEPVEAPEGEDCARAPESPEKAAQEPLEASPGWWQRLFRRKNSRT